MLKQTKFIFKPSTKQEKFGVKIYFLLVDNFEQTFLVGGTVRNALLRLPNADIDIATIATPLQVESVLKTHKIIPILDHKNFGVVHVRYKKHLITITTFRKEVYSKNRFPKVELVKSSSIDVKRRDFTINSLYLSLKNNTILDYSTGLVDIKNKVLRFNGNPTIKVKEDPLRIVRCIRFALDYNLKIDDKSFKALQKHFALIYTLSKNKLAAEIKKVKNNKEKVLLKKIIYTQKYLDTNFKRFII